MHSKGKALLVTGVVCLIVVVLALVMLYRPVEVQSGKECNCRDPKHTGDPILSSSVKTLRVASKDAGRYAVTVESVTCAKCQARANVEDTKARATRKKEDAFISALRKHDDQVLLYCRKIAGSAEADPYGYDDRSVLRDTKRLRSLALSGKQLCAPESLADVEYKYGKSMDELLKALPYIEQGMKYTDMDAMQTAASHMLLSKQYRDEAIAGVEGR